MITEDYVSLETAKLLKEKGFDEPCALTEFDCDAYKKWVETAPRPIMLDAESEKPFRYSVPSIYVAMKWLREVHSLWCEISWEGKGLWSMEVFSLMDEEFIPGSIVHEIKSYDEACEAAIKFCLENLI